MTDWLIILLLVLTGTFGRAHELRPVPTPHLPPVIEQPAPGSITSGA